jgi:hypothetical protein
MVGSNKTRNGSPNKVRICLAEALYDSYVCSGYIFPQGNRAPLLCYITMGRVMHPYTCIPIISAAKWHSRSAFEVKLHSTRPFVT